MPVLEWLMWQMGGFGPMPGQVHHFRMVEAESDRRYGLKRYSDETRRLYGVLDRRLGEVKSSRENCRWRISRFSAGRGGTSAIRFHWTIFRTSGAGTEGSLRGLACSAALPSSSTTRSTSAFPLSAWRVPSLRLTGPALSNACQPGSGPPRMVNDLWYKNAIIYCLSVGTFMDANGDGIGDFQGLMRPLDYLQGLGITTIWLMPFQPSPCRDNGYDISDYYNVDPRYGTLGDFTEFTHACRQRGLRVLIDLVVNHTSDQHAWFKEARRDPQSKYRDWYVWWKKKPANAKDGVVFPGRQKSTWTYDKEASMVSWRSSACRPGRTARALRDVGPARRAQPAAAGGLAALPAGRPTGLHGG